MIYSFENFIEILNYFFFHEIEIKELGVDFLINTKEHSNETATWLHDELDGYVTLNPVSEKKHEHTVSVDSDRFVRDFTKRHMRILYDQNEEMKVLYAHENDNANT